jgi:hypothetical protein
VDEGEAQLLADIEQVGWHMITVAEDDEGPGWTYSIGFFHSYGHPEVVVFGLPNDVMQGIVDSIASLIKAGSHFADRDETDQVLSGYPCVFRTVQASHYAAHFGYAQWFYKSQPFPILQCVWPDTTGRYPWEAGCEAGIVRLQPALYDNASL